MRKDRLNTLTNGIVKSNPTFRLVLGTCPTLAVTTQAINGLAMGAAVTFVLLCSNVMISLLKKVIPNRVRIPAFVVIIATFVTVVQMVMTVALLIHLAMPVWHTLEVILIWAATIMTLWSLADYIVKNKAVLAETD